jgi:hypothetical protein
MEGAHKTRLGRKWTCFSCARKFYDLQRPQPICPNCNADQEARPREEPTQAARKRTKKSARATAS